MCLNRHAIPAGGRFSRKPAAARRFTDRESDSAPHVHVASGTVADTLLYHDVQTLREKTLHDDAPEWGGPFSHQTFYDGYSEFYCAYVDGRPLGALTATRAGRGRLACEEYYPRDFLREERDRVVSTTQLNVITPTETDGFSRRRIIRLLVTRMWQDQLARGIRYDLIHASVRHMATYRQLGYLQVARSFFVHPVSRAPSYVMLLPADRSHACCVHDLFRGLTSPASAENAGKYLELIP
jgi:hypothetical protein